MIWRALLFVAPVVVSAASVAWACSYSVPAPHTIIANPDDDSRPSSARVELLRVKRGKEPADGCRPKVETSCDQTAYVLLHIEADDDVSNRNELGYVIEVTGTSANLSPDPAPVVTDAQGEIRLVWDEDGTDDLDMAISVWSVDRAGNVAENPTRVRVVRDGSDGCSLLPGSVQGAWLVLLLCALLLRGRPPG